MLRHLDAMTWIFEQFPFIPTEAPVLLNQAFFLLILCISRPSGREMRNKRELLFNAFVLPMFCFLQPPSIHAMVHSYFIFTSANNSPSMQLTPGLFSKIVFVPYIYIFTHLLDQKYTHSCRNGYGKICGTEILFVLSLLLSLLFI